MTISDRSSNHRVASLVAAIAAIVVVGTVLVMVFRNTSGDPDQGLGDAEPSVQPPTSARSAGTPSVPPVETSTALAPTMTMTATRPAPVATPQPVARFHQSLVSDLPASYLLRTDEEAWNWAVALVERYPTSTATMYSS